MPPGQKGHVTKMAEKYKDLLHNPAAYIVRKIPRGLGRVVRDAGYKPVNGHIVARTTFGGRLNITKAGVEIKFASGKRDLVLPMPSKIEELLSWDWLPALKQRQRILVKSVDIYGQEYGNVLNDVAELKKYIYKYQVDENKIIQVAIVGVGIQQLYTPEKLAHYKARVAAFNKSGKVRK